MISCLLRFGDDGPMGLLDVNWLTPEKRRELTVIGEGGMLSASYLTQDVWFTESDWRPHRLGRAGPRPRRRRGRAVRFALAPRRAAAGRARGVRRCVLEDTPEPVSAHEGCRALAAALAVRDSAANSRPVYSCSTCRATPPVARRGLKRCAA